MPTYIYICRHCGSTWEEQRTMINCEVQPDDGCPDCGSDYIQRGFTSPSIKFKGTGFYQTDKHKP